MPQPLKWIQIKQTGSQPNARCGHTITTIGKQSHILFGGLEGVTGKGQKTQPTNALYYLKLTQNTCDWRQIQIQGDKDKIEQPLPRTNHAACCIEKDKDQNQLLIFGGNFSSNFRFNDTWILKQGSGCWSWYQPPNQKSQGVPKNAESKIGAPEPRADHSATYNKGKVYVFGGHGGTGYTRQSFNDLYQLDIESFEWSKLSPNGNAPEPRGGHVASMMANQDKIMMYGGWNFTTQFSNLIIYDINKNEWVDPEISYDMPKWNSCAILVPSIPSWKYFVFGGSIGSFAEGVSRTDSKFIEEIVYLDIDSLEWKQCELEPEENKKIIKPRGREYSCMIYDNNEQRVLLFGGWANNWMDDMWSLNVSTITGPPYAIFSIKPSLGPLTGKTKVLVKGEGFKNSQHIAVKFYAGKFQAEVQGNYVSEQELTAETPSFESLGAKQMNVVVSINKGDYTIKGVQFTYYLNTTAENTIAYGPGILDQSAIGEETVFYIQARNSLGENRTSGADEFVIDIIRPDLVKKVEEVLENAEDKTRAQGKEKTQKVQPKEEQKQIAEGQHQEGQQQQPQQQQQQGEEKKEEQQPEQEVDPSKVPFKLVDKDDGSYEVRFKQDQPCEVLIDIKYKNQLKQVVPIRGNPFKCKFVKEADLENNQLMGPLCQDYIKNTLTSIREFITEANEDIDYKEKNLDNVAEVIVIMAMLSQIDKKTVSHILELDTIEEMIRVLKNIDDKKEFSEYQKECNALQKDWKNLIVVAKTVDRTILQPVNNHKEKTKELIKKQEEILKDYIQKLKAQSFNQYTTGVEGANKNIAEVQGVVDEFQKQNNIYEQQVNIFNFPDVIVECKNHLGVIQSEIKAIQKLWNHISVCQAKFEEYKKLKWGTINTNDMEDEVKKLKRQLNDQKGASGKSFAFAGIQDDLKRWGTFLPLLGELKDQSMDTTDQRHWIKLKKLVGKEFQVSKELELGVIWDLKLFDFKDGIEEIADQAKQELKMEKQLNLIITFWKDINFELVPHKQSEVTTLRMVEENFETLEDHQLQINNMLLSKYIAYYEQKVEKWKQDLGSCYDVIQLLSEVQKTWSFLENLFIQSEEVKKELPNESKQFVGIDKEMREIMTNGSQIKNVLQFCTQADLLHRLEQIQKDLKVCEKALNEFLDSKRKVFPRFYFVSVNDLLDILSNGNNPTKINRHMSKIFQAIGKLALKDTGDRPSVTEMISFVGVESVPMAEMKLVGKVEIYLQDVVNHMRQTLKSIAQSSFQANVQMERKDWIRRDPAQITLLVNNINWSSKVEESFGKLQAGDMNALKDFKDKSILLLTDLIKMVQGDLEKQLRQKIMCLITLDAHSRDVVIKLIDEHVRKPEEFQWQSQLKFYWNMEQNDAQIKIADAQFWYYYEYLGNGPRLVVTPLTDRIYVTATQALHLKMGCAPAGPAGTGKTETTKDLSNGVAKACYVFNCSSEMNYESMGNIYKGLASSGCWGCFDEFNRLLPEVLSVCSVQFKQVTDAIKNKAKKFLLEGDEISLDPSCGVFITMNPGYLGRAELPEGLKALFRPITVVVPDLELICENMLMAEGFVSAKVLAKKFVTLYMLCRDLLSKQLHYDWGLRAIKSVLVVAGTFKRAESDIPEDALLMRALRDFNMPKIAYTDLYVFFGLLGDLFPNLNPIRKRDMRFEGIIKDVCIKSKLYPEEEFILKVVQLYELLAIRHCVFIMGPPGSGKTSTWQVLAKAQDKDNKKTTYVDLDPKVVSTRDFYGYNLPSKEWKDGLFSKNLRNLAEMTDEENPKWIVMDGDLDANWIESMNSVMDDNKILTLANNERIPLKPHMRALFEIRDLRFATPATVSRAGILYISDDSGHQWKSYVKSWIEYEVQGDETKKTLQTLFDRYIEPTLQQLKKTVKYMVPVSAISQVISICKALSTMIQQNNPNIEYFFVYALVWGIGGALAEKDGVDYRKDFSSWWKNAWKTQVKFPSKGNVFDYFVDVAEGSIKFSEWATKLSSIDFDPTAGMQMGNITVPTIQTLATSKFIKNYIYVGHPSLMIGNAGCGKTQLSKGILKEIVTEKPENFAYQLINFNYYTNAEYLQIQLEQTLEKKAGRQFGPPGKVKMIYFIDDLNMPQLDLYDTQTAIALLRQHEDYGHWYDVGKLQLKDIINTQVIAAMNPSAGSFFVNPRYQRHFWTISIPFPDNESLHIIYITFLNGHFKRFRSVIQEQATNIVKASMVLHQTVQSSFRKTAINFHYEFNLRHITNIFQGLLLSDPNKYQEPEKIIKLWIHECERTYGDRLVSYEHLKQYKDGIYEIIKKQFTKSNFQRFFTGNNPEALIYSNFVNGINLERFYDQMNNKDLYKIIDEGLREYNNDHAYMGLVLFEDALRHVCKICRIILPPSGHALLVGVGGSGKQSLSKLSAFIMQLEVYQITISATYSMNDLKENLKELFQKCGPKEEGRMFLFTEGQITNERFLVYINDLLSSGEIADLYTIEEKEIIINSVRPKVKGEGKPDTKDNCWSWFINTVKKNLHMSICFSPVGDMRRRARQFPALVNCTVIDWFQPWPYEALYNVAKQFLSELDLGSEKIQEAVIKFMPHSFTVVNQLGIKLLETERRYAYTTPKSFLELISLFKNMLQSKKDKLEKDIERYESGLVKLKATEDQVTVIEVEVKEKQIEAEAKKKEADAFAEVVGKEKDKVEKENAKAKVEQDKCSIIKQDVEEKKRSTQKDLDDAQPLCEQAIAALNSINIKDFQIAKKWATPPQGIPDVFSATIFLLAGFYGEIEVDKNKKPKAYDWKAAQKMMKEPQTFVDTMKAFKDQVDQNLVPQQNVMIVKSQYLSLPHFDPEIQAQKSAAAKGVCMWVLNIVKYWDVIQNIEPKRKALKEATEQLEEATVKLNQVEEIVKKLNEELFKLTSEFDRAIAEKNAALAEADRCARRLNLAQRLVKALGSEKDRWAKSIISLQDQYKLIVGDVLLASSFVSYAGPFNKRFRQMMMNDEFMKFMKEQEIPMSAESNPVKILTDDSIIAQWNKQFLPSDVVSVENGTILTNSDRYPLMIDPQLQGITWIKEKEKNSNLKLLRLGSKYINRDLELSIENGYSALIENMGERIDAILLPVIARQFFKRGKNKILKFQGKDLTIDPKFKLFLHTKLFNPHYPPEIQAEAALINFMVTEAGLGDQLLSLVVGRERPELAKRKVELIQQQNDFKIKLKELEVELLQKLANAKGDILDDIALIENLEYSKKLSTEIEEKVNIAKTTEAKINEASEHYRLAANRGALFYFLLSDLSKIHSFYRYSLESFITVINRSIDQISERKMFSGKNMQAYTGKEEELGKQGQQEEEEAQQQPVQEQPKTIQEEKKAEEANQQQQQQPVEEKKQDQQAKEGGDQQQQLQEKEGEEAKKEGQQGAEGEIPDGESKKKKKKVDELEMEEPMSPRTLKKRVEDLIESLTYTAFQSTRRGLFEKHKLIVATMLTLRILLRSEQLLPEEVEHLIIGKVDSAPTPMPEVLKSFLNDNIWAACKALDKLPSFQGLCQSLETEYLQWKKWYSEEKAEVADLPKAFKDLDKFHRLLLLRALRQDRLTSALSSYVIEQLGERYIEQPASDISEVFLETTHQQPIFFVLFPGVDPTTDVEKVAAKYDISILNGRFINISMGQGQENRAKNAIFDCAKKGYWIQLQNIHLMQSWLAGLNGLEGFLEQVFSSNKTHPNFRIFISSEPPPLPEMKIIPESILQGAIKIANEAPQFLKANLRRAYAKFDQPFLEKCDKKPAEFKACLFALCFFHSLILGRKKFGSQGWSRNYNFNDGDLTICSDVLFNYLSKYDVVPWADLRYIFGEIMYGGHITDDWDRRTNRTYLEVLIKPELMQLNFNLAPGFKSPDPNKFDYEKYKLQIEQNLPQESPQLFGMHPNAEIGYLTQQCDALMNTILDVQGGSTGGGIKPGKKDDSTMTFLLDLQNRTPKEFNMLLINDKVQQKTPFIVVCLQECERMNTLLQEIKRTLEDLRLGLTGALNMTDAMESLVQSLSFNKVSDSWEKKAYFSKKGLAAWFSDLIERVNQLANWTKEMETPKSLCIAYLFNPMSFLTAIMQKTARDKGLPLDNMALQTNPTSMREHTDVVNKAENGAYIHGLFLEGAAWEIGGEGQEGYLIDQKPKDLHPQMPVINVISVPTSQLKTEQQYHCPTYVTSQRGPTFVFTANLNMEDDNQSKWILSGTCMLMSDD